MNVSRERIYKDYVNIEFQKDGTDPLTLLERHLRQINQNITASTKPTTTTLMTASS